MFHLSAATLCLPVLNPQHGTELPPWRWLPLSLSAGFVGSLAWTGHSGATPGPTGDLQLATDALHLLAAGAWAGGLLPLAMLLTTARSADQGGASLAAVAAKRFSLLGMISVGTLFATGVVSTWDLVGSLPALMETSYGRLLCTKICLFAAMVGVAAVNRFGLVPRLSDLDKVRKLQRNSYVEAGLGLLVITVVAALGTIPPAVHMQAHTPQMH